MLYLLKLGEIVQTIPSIGFNVETFEAPTSSGKYMKLEGWDVGGGCGSIVGSKIMVLYTARSDIIIWIVDSSDRTSLAESVDALEFILKDMDSERSKDGLSKNYPVLLFANKQDLPNVISIDEIRKAFAESLSGRTSAVFKTSLTTTDIEKTGLPDAFEWLRFALDTVSTGSGLPPPHSARAILEARSSTSQSEKLESWVTRTAMDSTPEDFIFQFQSLSLPSWDHYTHIRIAFLLLTTYGRQKGKNMIFDGIERYISESPQTRGRTFHVTMTYFWIQVVHLGIRNISPSTDLKASETVLPSSMTHIASPDQFGLFLVLNPYVADGNLWADYYSKGVMMSPAAKGGMVLPDIKPLPNLVVRDAI
ncbi:hypothetical protein DXG03_005111 [Asterophora parasitica]|uniref:GTP-binding protein n=1 Tax=Asterophora parasitica TaxID=117018 RepID=A0A9P7G634_9AGAR|nr:hypothetical protein DXG03_005111 [Asterophora parasitica]